MIGILSCLSYTYKDLQQKGYLFVKPEKPSDFRIEAGEDVLRTYTFGNELAGHKVI